MSQSTIPSSSRRGLPKWLKVTIVLLLVVANLAALGALWAIKTGQSFLATADTDSQVADVLDVASGDDLTFLIVGSDSREGLDSLQNFGSAGGERGDVVMLVRLDSGTSSAQMLSIPRDLYVDIEGHGRNRINAAYAFGGPSLMVETIKSNLGVEVNHYVEIDFVGFSALVDELGGIEVDFPFPARDANSGLSVSAGTQTLDGDMALAYARSRHYQENHNGSWVSVEASDIGRTQRQQTVIRSIMAELKSPSSIADASNITGAMAQHMTIDSKLASTSVAGLAWDFKGVLTGSVEGATLPTKGATIDGRSVVLIKEPEAGAMLANFKAGAPLADAATRVQVLNGNGVGGSAGKMSQTLQTYGYAVGSIDDAESDDFLETTVVVPSGSSKGERIVAALGFGVVRVGTVDNGYDAIVIVGADAP
ncbi:MAG: LCP family protein [Acidimicrobiia bacterium]